MILLFTKTLPDKKYAVDVSLSTLETEPQTEFAALNQPVASFFAPTEGLPGSCKYPLNIKELFPYWLRLNENGNSVLISLTQNYYDWISCNASDINTLSFLKLEDLLDTETIPEELIQHLAYTYFNSLPTETITNNIVSPQKVKQIIDNIKINLYAKKGSEDSFRSLINDFFGVDPDKITISYPKKYILRLNGGRYEWMQTTQPSETPKYTELSEFYPESTSSYLNYSVIQDNNLWQDFSYVLTTPGVSLDAYTAAIKPVLHPAGTKDFFNIRFDIPNNPINDNVTYTESEISVFRNYALYTLGSTGSIGHTFGCSGSYGGVTGYPIYKFPTWDEQISQYEAGISFADVIVGDFTTLTPLSGYTYPNEGLTCS
jgi:hypothetical protein